MRLDKSGGGTEVQGFRPGSALSGTRAAYPSMAVPRWSSDTWHQVAYLAFSRAPIDPEIPLNAVHRVQVNVTVGIQSLFHSMG